MKESLILAGIDLGSNALKMKIVQSNQGEIKVLENVSRGLPLGDEAFRLGELSESTVEQLVEQMIFFARLLKEYQVDDYLAVATNSLRVASNGVFVRDLIRRKSGLEVTIIEDPIEKFLTYKSMRDLEPALEFRKDGTVLVELTSGGCDITLYRDNKMLRNDEIGIGTQHLKSILSELLKKTPNYMEVLEEYINTRVDYIKNILKKKVVANYLAVGGDIKSICRLFFHNTRRIKAKDFNKLYHEILEHREDLIDKAVSLHRDWIEILASLVFFKVFLEITRCDEIIIPAISLRDGLIAELLDRRDPQGERYRDFNEDPYHASYQVAKRLGSHSRHIRFIERHSVQLAKVLAEEFSLEEEDLLRLRHAALLHEIGKSLDLNYYLQASASMVRGMRIFSLRSDQIEGIAEIIDVLHQWKLEQRLEQVDLKNLQLAAILTVFDALDASKQQKIKILDMDLQEDRLTMEVRREESVLLEEEELQEASRNFAQIFGLEIHLKEIS